MCGGNRAVWQSVELKTGVERVDTEKTNRTGLKQNCSN